MKYLNNYKLWKEINEELEDSTIVSAANEHEKEGRPQKADELRAGLEKSYKDEFKFYFFPLSIKGDIVTFRAYVDNREDAVKVSRILKIFNNLTGLPEVNNLWREIEKTHKSEGLVTVNYSNGPKFIFKPSAGYFVSHYGEDYANPREAQVLPIVLYHDYPFTHMMSGPKFINYANFQQSGPGQIIKINFDAKKGILTTDIKIDFGGMGDYYNQEVIRVAGGSVKEEEKPQAIENYDELLEALEMYEERPKASLEKLSQLRPNLSDIFNKEITFILRKAIYSIDNHELVKISKDPHSVSNIYKAYVESEKEAKGINEVIKLFLLLRDGKMSVTNYKENTLITEKKEGDIEVKAKFVPIINPALRRSKDNFEFFGFEFEIDAEKFNKESNRFFDINNNAYITLIDEFSTQFEGSKLFTIIPKY